MAKRKKKGGEPPKRTYSVAELAEKHAVEDWVVAGVASWRGWTRKSKVGDAEFTGAVEAWLASPGNVKRR